MTEDATLLPASYGFAGAAAAAAASGTGAASGVSSSGGVSSNKDPTNGGANTTIGVPFRVNVAVNVTRVNINLHVAFARFVHFAVGTIGDINANTSDSSSSNIPAAFGGGGSAPRRDIEGPALKLF